MLCWHLLIQLQFTQGINVTEIQSVPTHTNREETEKQGADKWNQGLIVGDEG